MLRLFMLLSLAAGILLVAGCAVPILPGTGGPIPTVGSNTLIYEGVITFPLRNGKTLPGINLGYQGKSADGRALLLINGQQAAKQSLDSVVGTGSPVPGVLLTVNARVANYDQTTVNLFGTIRVEVADAVASPSDLPTDLLTAFSIPVQYTVPRGEEIPGTHIQYLGQDAQGASFSNVGEYPYRQQFDSIVYSGHLRDKVGIKLDLRLISASEESAQLVGQAQVQFEK